MMPETRLALSLLLLRIGVFVVMFAWTIDKLLRPEHMASVYQRYYFIGWIDTPVAYFFGSAELALILAFVLGAWKRWTYGAVLALHAVSTLATLPKYFAPFDAHNLLYFAAWPMLAACAALYLMRDADTMWSTSTRSGR